MEGELKFRDLRADEVELRVQQVFNGDNGVAQAASFLLYKDARCDMNILDEVVGALNWKREHRRENANCVVSIWDPRKKEWVSKEDTGTESNTEKEKGLASDSFKRACFNWGIGRELYTAPDIKIEFEGNEGKYKRIWGLHVSDMVVENGQIIKLVVSDNKKDRFAWVKGVPAKAGLASNSATKKEAKVNQAPSAVPSTTTNVPQAVTENQIPAPKNEDEKLITACKTKAELNALFVKKNWLANQELLNYAKPIAAKLPKE